MAARLWACRTMGDVVKVRYEIELFGDRPDLDTPDVDIRQLAPTDRDALAHLMLDAYIGTIDYEGETLKEARDGVDSWLEGSPLVDHSCGAIIDGQIVSAVLVSVLDESPFIAIVMTDPAHKGARLARAVTEAALISLKRAGHSRVALYITKGNTPSEKLFAAIGARPSSAR